MGQGVGSARLGLLVGVGILCLLIVAKPSLATEYIVGDSEWTFNVNNWPNGKSFKAGDELVFKYSKNAHNVVVVNKEGYDSCTAPSGSKEYNTGMDKITLSSGPSYYICSYTGHCQGGMKIAINAA